MRFLRVKVRWLSLLIIALTAMAVRANDTHETSKLVGVATNRGQVVETYKTADGEATVSYPAITNDVPFAYASSTNNGRIYDCCLLASQLKNAPRWDPEKAPPPLAPKEAARIAVGRAFVELGPSPYAPASLEPASNWQVVEITLVQRYLWFVHDYVWYYRVPVKRVVTGSSPGITDAVMFITMDGRVARYLERGGGKSNHGK